uniref:Uncharacterized protein n=1 Tax=Lepeophtheirus salmonis TaxID=72036 RepID=A0A0K2U8W4_LEPSM
MHSCTASCTGMPSSLLEILLVVIHRQKRCGCCLSLRAARSHSQSDSSQGYRKDHINLAQEFNPLLFTHRNVGVAFVVWPGADSSWKLTL